jgi:hypothetical protein
MIKSLNDEERIYRENFSVDKEHFYDIGKGVVINSRAIKSLQNDECRSSSFYLRNLGND